MLSALLYGKVNEDRVMQHESVGDWHWQPQCIGHCYLLKDGLVDVDGVMDDAGVCLDFDIWMAEVLVVVDNDSHSIDDVEQEQNAEDSDEEPQAV